jgi:hypothetical protein
MMTEFYKFLQLYTSYILIPTSLLGLLLIVANWIYTQILLFYLKNNMPDRWKELADTLFVNNIFKRYRYIFGTVDDKDQNILRLKTKIRNLLKLGLLLFVGVPMFFVFLFLICVISGQR